MVDALRTGELVRSCRCGAHFIAETVGEGSWRAGEITSDRRRAVAALLASQEAVKNAQRNVAWARCPQCGSRPRSALLAAAVTQLWAPFILSPLGFVLGVTLGPSKLRGHMHPTTVLLCAVFSITIFLIALAASTWNRLRQVDTSTVARTLTIEEALAHEHRAVVGSDT